MQNAFKQAGITDYLLIELENREDCSEAQNYLQKITGGKTVSIYLLPPRLNVNLLQNYTKEKQVIENSIFI